MLHHSNVASQFWKLTVLLLFVILLRHEGINFIVKHQLEGGYTLNIKLPTSFTVQTFGQHTL